MTFQRRMSYTIAGGRETDSRALSMLSDACFALTPALFWGSINFTAIGISSKPQPVNVYVVSRCLCVMIFELVLFSPTSLLYSYHLPQRAINRGPHVGRIPQEPNARLPRFHPMKAYSLSTIKYLASPCAVLLRVSLSLPQMDGCQDDLWHQCQARMIIGNLSE